MITGFRFSKPLRVPGSGGSRRSGGAGRARAGGRPARAHGRRGRPRAGAGARRGERGRRVAKEPRGPDARRLLTETRRRGRARHPARRFAFSSVPMPAGNSFVFHQTLKYQLKGWKSFPPASVAGAERRVRMVPRRPSARPSVLARKAPPFFGFCSGRPRLCRRGLGTFLPVGEARAAGAGRREGAGAPGTRSRDPARPRPPSLREEQAAP